MNSFLKDFEPYGGAIEIVTTIFKCVKGDGSKRRFPTPCKCLKELTKLISLNNYLYIRGLSLPYHLEQDIEKYAAGKGLGCQWHWNGPEENEGITRSVYYVEVSDFGMIKIGYSENPYKRLGEIRFGGLGEDANILALEPGWSEVESIRHKQFRHDRNRIFSHDGGTELFFDSDEMRDWIQEVRDKNGMLRMPKYYERRIGEIPS